MKTIKPIILGFALLVIGIGAGFFYWLNVVRPNGGVATPNSQGGIDACVEFKTVDYKISCEEAVAIALRHSPGIVRKVSIGSVRSAGFFSDRSPQEALLWVIDIQVANPYFDTSFQKEIKFLRIGIDIDQRVGISIKPLEL